ncbi:MAG: FAD:protein FMN transferase [Peptostreptococcaceae bacterium]|nr:FAD:protein FMN transferase [Peptostreptococcaceae bacterium]MDY5738745.1 FAD:protein FMN transferase [Anaerovoracaceae bacterium]
MKENKIRLKFKGSKHHRLLAFLLIIPMVFALSACSSSTDEKDSKESTIELYNMDTYMTVTAYGENADKALEKVREEVNRIDKLLSTGLEESEVYKINSGAADALSEDTYKLLDKSLQLYKDTDGAFNIAVYPIMEAWGFTTKNYKVPDDETIARLLTLATPDDILFNRDEHKIAFAKEGMKIDFGGIAKGYTSARIMEIFKECGVKSGKVNLGGNVQTLGTKTDGSKWRIAIQSPDKGDEYAGVLEVADKAIITSGGYERFFEENGVTYHHIIDPKTGKPAKSGLQSVTIVSDDGTLADGLSTSLFIMGKDKSVEFWKKHKDEFQFVLLTDDNKLVASEGLKGSLTSDRYEVEFVSDK